MSQTRQTKVKAPLSFQKGFQTGFRPFFLLAGALGCVSMVLWIGLLNGWVVDGINDPMWWHGHEMTFGFSGAVLAGFLMTAVPNWSGLPAVKGFPLAVLALVWLLVRVSLVVVGEQHPLSYGLDIAWWLAVTFVLAKPLIVKRLWSNLFFVPVLLLLTLLNGLSYYGASGHLLSISDRINSGSALIVTSVMLVMAGRIFPIYIANTLGIKPIAANRIVDIAAAVSTALFTLSWLFIAKTEVSVWPMAVLALCAGCLHIFRMSRWPFMATLKTPLLWSLLLAYLFIGLGFIGISHALVFAPQNLMIMLHLCTVGGMGAIILSMMTRVTLGHTGQPLVAPKTMTVAFTLIVCAVLARTVLPMLMPSLSLEFYSISGLCWAVAFALFLLRFGRTLST